MGNWQSGLLHLTYSSPLHDPVTHKLKVQRDSFITWRGISSAVHDTFGVDDSQAFYLQFFLAGQLTTVSNQDEESADLLIDIKVGAHPYYHVISFPAAAPPSLHDCLQQARSAMGVPDTAALSELYLVETRDGGLVRIANEANWIRVGWPRATKVFKEGRAEGDWQAATFQLGASSLPTYTSSSSSSLAPPTSTPVPGSSRSIEVLFDHDPLETAESVTEDKPLLDRK
ncbi:hypothetical protein JCM11641_004617 [Rhodosporidiobolus odoratus]